MAKSKKQASQWADVDGGAAFIIPYTAIRHPNFLRLTPHAVKLLIDLGRQYSGFNNGYLCPAWTLMKEVGWKSRGTLFWAVRECEHYGFIVLTRQGGRNAANLYAFTWWRIHEKPEKRLDKAPTITPSNAWKNDRPPFKRSPKITMSYTPGVSPLHARRVNGGKAHTPGVSHLADSHAKRVSAALSK